VHQWSKNALLAVPLVTAHYMTNLSALTACVLAILSFSLAASSLYIVNDLLDLDADRLHPTKKFRPFAAGTLSIRFGLVLSFMCFVAACALASRVSSSFTQILAVYIAGSFLYSTTFKSMLLIDVLFLAGLYSLRIISGGIAISVPISQWLIAFSSFFFLSLALAKRVVELNLLRESPREKLKSRGYMKGDAGILSVMGVAAGYLSVLIFALWIDSPTVSLLYREPRILWLIAPLLTLWISRVWILAHRGDLHDDPVVFALTDGQSLLTVTAGAALVLLAIAL
jgi:4-hydroxybenzoate polyprenyltransferase